MRSIGFDKEGREWVDLTVPKEEWDAMPGCGFPAVLAYCRAELGVDVKRWGCNGVDYWVQGYRIAR